MFLEVISYSNNRGVGWFTIIFPPIFMLLVWFYMHMIQGKSKDTHFLNIHYHVFTQDDWKS
jgi:hypothetical protein